MGSVRKSIHRNEYGVSLFGVTIADARLVLDLVERRLELA